MSNVESPEPNVSTRPDAGRGSNDPGLLTLDPRRELEPSAEELAVLSAFERFSFRWVQRMNRGNWKRFWTFCQRTLGAGWIQLATYNLMQVYGLEHVEATRTAFGGDDAELVAVGELERPQNVGLVVDDENRKRPEV